MFQRPEEPLCPAPAHGSTSSHDLWVTSPKMNIKPKTFLKENTEKYPGDFEIINKIFLGHKKL